MIFDALHYFETLAQQNILCRNNGFKPVFCSGPDSIEGVMQQFQKTANFIMIDDTTDQNLYSEGVSYFKRMIWDRARHENEDDDITFLNVEKIYSKEFGRYTMNGVTGLYFMVENDEPESMDYEDEQQLESEWITEEEDD